MNECMNGLIDCELNECELIECELIDWLIWLMGRKRLQSCLLFCLDEMSL